MADKELLTCKSERLSSFLVDTDLIKKDPSYGTFPVLDSLRTLAEFFYSTEILCCLCFLLLSFSRV